MPKMVDVTAKDVTGRVATAVSKIQLPREMSTYLQGSEIVMKKGPVFQTAIIAGTMAAKKTAELIPFCHQIPIEGCKFEVAINSALLVTFTCTVKTTSKTGVEMEALHGAMTAALTVYDMCKAISHNMTILETKLLSKTGGKHTILDQPLYGLVLTGGESRRMGHDKALISYRGQPHAAYVREILQPFCTDVYLSARDGQWSGTSLEGLPTINDLVEGQGPMGGILAAFDRHPDANWMIVATDLPYFSEKTISRLLFEFDPTKIATCFKNSEKGFPEPLCAIYTPLAKSVFEKAWVEDMRCPVKVLRNLNVHLIEADASFDLANVNTQEELAEVQV